MQCGIPTTTAPWTTAYPATLNRTTRLLSPKHSIGGLLHSGYHLGMLIAAALNYFTRVVPALFVLYIHLRTVEPERSTNAAQETHREPFWEFFAKALGPQYRLRTWGNLILLTVGLMGFWAGSQYLVTTTITLAACSHLSTLQAQHLGAWGMAVLGMFTIIGCFIAPWLSTRIGRRKNPDSVFHSDDHRHRWRLHVCVLSEESNIVFHGHTTYRNRWSEFCCIHDLATRAVSHRSPCQWIRVFDYFLTICSSRWHISYRVLNQRDAHYRYSGLIYCLTVCDWHLYNHDGSGNKRIGAYRMKYRSRSGGKTQTKRRVG